MPSRRTLLVSAGALLATLVVGGGAAVAYADDDVPRGTTVRALDIGGLSRAQAVERVAGAYGDERATPISLVADGEVLTLDPAAAGIDLDAEASVERALDVSPWQRLSAFVGASRELDAVAAVDEAALSGELRRLAGEFDRPPREGALAFDDEGEIVETLPETGRSLDVTGAAEAVRGAYLVPRVEVPSEVVSVETTEDDVREAREQILEPAVAAPISVKAGDRSARVTAAAVRAALRVEVVDGELTPLLDAEVLHERVGDNLQRVGLAPVDATFRIENGAPVLVPAVDGTSISPDDLAAAVLSVLTDDEPREATAPLTPAQARVTTERAATLNINELMASYTSAFPCCAPRVTNIQRIAEIVDGYVLLPGERFDLNGVVGPRDTARGFVAAPQILDGEFVDSVGGGVSQFATAIFNTTFFSGLKDIAHSPHSFYISRYPPGREATVSFPQPALIFENDTPNGVLIKASTTGTSVTVDFWGTKQFDEIRSVTGPRTRPTPFVTQYDQRPTCSSTSGSDGFDIAVTRVFVAGGRDVDREEFRTRYKPQPRIICGPPPSAPSPSAAPSPAAEPESAAEPEPAPTG